MGRLDISGADYGFDESGSYKALENINEQIIKKVIEQMEASVGDLMEAVDAAWVGPSAEIFKDNVYTDLNAIEYGIEDARQKIYEVFSKTQQEMYNADEQILTKREGEFK